MVRTLLLLAIALTLSSRSEAGELGPRLRRSMAADTPARNLLPDDPVDVFVRTSRPEALRAALTAEGVTLRGDGEALRARLPVSVLDRVSAHFDHADLAPPMRPMLDKSLHEVGADLVHAGTGLPRARNGKGVLIGVLDTGIDLTHPAFLDAHGQSRVIAVWDQDAEGPGPFGFGYGVVCDRGQIRDGRCHVDDTQAHGTHVAGILAGSMQPHVGLAPEAELVVVKSTRFSDVAGAVEWMFRVAQAEGKPMVVNLSIGGHLGAHDGQSDLERALESLQGPGHIIVAAAGNDGATPIHLRAPGAVKEARAELLLPSPGAQTASLVEMWESGDAAPSFSVEAYTDRGERVDRRNLANGIEAVIGNARVTLDTDAQATQGKRHHLLTIDLSLASKDGEALRYVLVWRSKQTLDMWISTEDYRYGAAEFATMANDLASFVAGDSKMTLTMPGTAKNLITVGSYVTKNQWQSDAGRVYRIQQAELAHLSSFSSVGPSAAPELTGEKPDLIAPGQLIAGPLSTSAKGLTVLAVDQHFAVMQGTSMSAPHVAGSVALLLEIKPSLTPAEAKALLVETAKSDAMIDSIPSDTSGYGRLSTLDAVARLQGMEPLTRGCQNVPSGDGMTLIVMVLASLLVVQSQTFRMRLFRLRALANARR